jgi:hypothetical protein
VNLRFIPQLAKFDNLSGDFNSFGQLSSSENADDDLPSITFSSKLNNMKNNEEDQPF